jgi:hypothetical protein
MRRHISATRSREKQWITWAIKIVPCLTLLHISTGSPRGTAHKQGLSNPHQELADQPEGHAILTYDFVLMTIDETSYLRDQKSREAMDNLACPSGTPYFRETSALALPTSTTRESLTPNTASELTYDFVLMTIDETSYLRDQKSREAMDNLGYKVKIVDGPSGTPYFRETSALALPTSTTRESLTPNTASEVS